MVTDFRKKMIVAIETFVCLKTTPVLFQAYIIVKRMVSGNTVPLNQTKSEDGEGGGVVCM
jgi:hypothetical protein